MNTAEEPDRWRRLEALFFEALDLDPAARPAFVEQSCGTDISLRQELQSLLSSSDRTLAGLRRPVEELAGEVIKEASRQQIGPYQIIRLLGEGGMGLVYLARRADDQYQRLVAIKLMHAGLGRNTEMLRRFRAERQILANLDHPNIARLLDGGITAAGAPYLVMEYVDGIPIDDYCRRHPFTTAERLQLFRTVCGAVEYAHRNLVVHRDIKPGNILVTEDGTPKLLDFGIAKLLDPENSNRTFAYTVETQRLMTPEYASPEQVRGEPVTTATDVYALGVLLYELLTGRPPFRLESISPLDVARVICEQEPAKPSTASRSNPALSPLETRELKGDLDNIVLKAMRKEPGRRYPSVAQLSEDVRCYLKGYPVEARGGARRYRAGKFVRRHKAALVAVVAGVLAVVGFGIGMGLLAQRATRERLTAERESQLLANIFEAATPDQARGSEVTARQLLDQGAIRVDRELAGEPALQASMLDNIGRAYDALGLYSKAEPLVERAYELRTRTPGNRKLDLATSLEDLANTLRLQDQYEKAEPLFRQALEIRQKALGGKSDLVAESLSGLGECLFLENKDAGAESVLRKALAIPSPQDSITGANTRNYLALELFRKGGYREAAGLLEEAVEIDRRVDGPDSPSYATSLHNLAGAFSREGDLIDAAAMDRKDLEILRRILGPGHPNLRYTLNNLGYELIEMGKWREAEPYLAENLTISLKVFGENSPGSVAALDNWARLLQAKGDYAGAEKYFQEALDVLQQDAKRENWSVAQLIANLGVLEFDRADYAGAERYGRQALEMRHKLGGDQHPDVAASLLDVAMARSFQGDPASAEPLARQALEIRKTRLEAGDPGILEAEVRLGEVLTWEGKAAEAEPILRAAVESAQHPPFPLVPWQEAEAGNALGACLLSLHHTEEGRTLLEQSRTGLQTDPRPAFRKLARAAAAPRARRAASISGQGQDGQRRNPWQTLRME